MKKLLCLALPALFAATTLYIARAEETTGGSVPDAQTAIKIIRDAYYKKDPQHPLEASLTHQADGDFWAVHAIKPHTPGKIVHGGVVIWYVSKDTGKITRHVSGR
jgi:hypothetical protein